VATKSVFRESVILSGLLTREQLRRAIEELRAAGSTEVTDDELINHLVQRGLLTGYQAAQLRAGRTKLNLGPYLVTDYIDKGGMGQVYKATHRVMGREVAVKVLPLHKATPEAIETFIKEIRTQAQLDHPNLVRAYDAGQDGRVYYLVTEYVPGTDLRRLVRSRGPLPIRQAASIVMQAALGLAYAHSRNLIHRDVKPGNILVTPDGVAKLSDLGLAGFIQEASQESVAGRIVGTPDYVAPEVIEDSSQVGPINDIYSLGCTLYYAVTGKVPFPGGSTADKLRRHRFETPWHPRRFNPEINEEFAEIIADMMAKSPAERIASAAEVAARLQPWAGETSGYVVPALSKSPWKPFPLPTYGDDESQETSVGPADEDVESSRPESVPGSQWTDSLASGSQDTRVQRSRPAYVTPPIFLPEPAREPEVMGRGVCVAITLAISIPISMLLGAALTYLVLQLGK
jgi:serine/threonine protein kinase